MGKPALTVLQGVNIQPFLHKCNGQDMFIMLFQFSQALRVFETLRSPNKTALGGVLRAASLPALQRSVGHRRGRPRKCP
jgi:hypothetical protein